MKKSDNLRKKYPKFVYKDYSYRIKGRNLKISFNFEVKPKISFSPSLIIKNINKARLNSLSKRVLDNLVFHLGLIELFSYWKATCSPEIEIRCGKLNEEQTKWWKDLLIKGMGEFFYINKINFTHSDFLKIKSGKGDPRECFKKKIKERILVPIGGGKDSIVTLEILKDVNCFSLNPISVTEKIMKIKGCKDPVIVKRKIDKRLLELNQKGFLNGHVPFSAYLAFLSVLLGVIFDYKYLAFSNERSANEENLKYLGKSINHQYSKSFDFEKRFRKYSRKYLAKEIEYFSFLRPLYEVQISKLFSRYSKYFSTFLSCNKTQRISFKKVNDSWCGNCPKCLFIFLSLYPFLGREKLVKIFGKNLFEDKKLLSIMLGLVGEKKLKPFECVGTRKESLACFYWSLKKERLVKKLPFLLNYFEKKILPRYSERELLNSWNKQHNLSKRLEKLLKENMILSDMGEKKILILGFGREGRDTFEFLRKLFPGKILGIGDKSKVINKKGLGSKVKFHLGKNYLKSIKDHDVIIKSPGIPFKELPSSKKITSQTKIFFDNCPGMIIGITGTKGKSTTTSLIYKVLKEANFKVHLVGNIGNPVLSFLSSATPEDIYVYELSSHQLYNLRKSPRVAVFLNIFPEHLDYYKNFKEYIKAKTNIFHHQNKNDYLVFNSQDRIVKKAVQKSKSKRIIIRPGIIKKMIKDSPLQGRFNFQNVAAAIEVGKLFGISDRKIAQSIKTFKPLAHRLEFIGQYQGIKFYNDSLSTIPEASIGAINTIGKDVQTIILGGFDRGLDFKNLAKEISKSKIENAILFPSTGKRIWKEIKKKRLINHFFVNDMAEAVKLCFQKTEKGRVCLLSPASPSFGLFKDYIERGNLFKKEVKKYAKGY